MARSVCSPTRCRALGRMRLAPMLSPAGKLLGDLTVTRLGAERFWLVGSYYLQEWHLRWFRDLLPSGGVRLENLSESWLGFSLSGPRSREILARVDAARMYQMQRCRSWAHGRSMSGSRRPIVARVSLTGELGYEITVRACEHRALWHALLGAGTPLGMRPIGMRAQDSLRLEKGYGVWSLEFAQSYTPAMSGLDRYIAFDKGEFVGRAAALQEKTTRAGTAAGAVVGRQRRCRRHRLRAGQRR